MHTLLQCPSDHTLLQCPSDQHFKIEIMKHLKAHFKNIFQHFQQGCFQFYDLRVLSTSLIPTLTTAPLDT